MNIQNRKTTNAIFRGIIIIRYSILILSFFPVLPGYITQQVLEVNTRAMKNPRKQPQNFTATRRTSRARRGTSRTNQTSENWEIYVRGVWSFSVLARSGPGRQLGKLSTGYPQFFVTGEFGSLYLPLISNKY